MGSRSQCEVILVRSLRQDGWVNATRFSVYLHMRQDHSWLAHAPLALRFAT